MPIDFKEDWGAKQMVAEGAMENPRPEAVFALHCRPTITPKGADLETTRYLEAGQFSYASGYDSANSDTFEVVIKGTMAHGSAPQRGVDVAATASPRGLAASGCQYLRVRTKGTAPPSKRMRGERGQKG
jgi:amidohydrolase